MRIIIGITLWFMALVVMTTIAYIITLSAFASFMLALVAEFVLMGFFLKHFVIVVPAMRAAVLQNVLEKESLQKFPAGFSVKYPWEVLWKEFDLQREVQINSEEGGKPYQTCSTQDGVVLNIQWMFQMFVCYDRLEAHWKWQEKAIISGLKAHVSRFVSDYVAKRKAMEIIQDKATLGNELADIFGGSDSTSAEEEKYGVRVTDPELFDADLDVEVQKVMAGQAKADFLRKTIKELMEQHGLSAAEANETALLLADKLSKKIYQIQGLEELRHVHFVGVPGFGEKSENKKDKGGK